MTSSYVFTSESVTEGHPDKLCDQISDAAIDAVLSQDPMARMDVECAVSTGIVFIASQSSTTATVDLADVARRVIDDVGYDGPRFNARSCGIMLNLSDAPEGWSRAVDETTLGEADFDRFPARQQVTVFGFACDHTPERMPLPIALAHDLARALTEARKAGAVPRLGPDGKTQVGILFEDGRPTGVHSVTLMASLAEGATEDDALRGALIEVVVDPVLAARGLALADRDRLFINPLKGDGVGGPAVHSGLTGRKNGIDTYGEYARHSGAALSGKDPGRIDRVAAYVARYAANNLVAAGLAARCEVHVTYTIGQAQPITVRVNSFGTGTIGDDLLAERVRRAIDFRPAAIVARFGLRHLPRQANDGFYRKLAVFGHFGRTDLDTPWERTDQVEALRG